MIIPTYNSAGTLKLAIESVLRQTFSDFEVIVVGDGCTDESEKVVSSIHDDRLIWVAMAPNSGSPSKPRNEAVRLSKGRFIAYLGHDDLWFPWHLLGLVESIEKKKGDFVYSLGAIIGREGASNVIGFPGLHQQVGLSPSNWMHVSALTDRIGNWPVEIRFGDDLEFSRRIHKSGASIVLHKRLSVLKFPSNQWRSYSRIDNFPQATYLESMRENPEALELDILSGLASVVAQYQLLNKHNLLRGKKKGLLPKRLGFLASRITHVYGSHRWPLNRLLHWRWRVLSGLEDKHNRRK